MISALQHPHLVKLYGCCIEGNQLLLVYEYMENNSLARALFGKVIIGYIAFVSTNELCNYVIELHFLIFHPFIHVKVLKNAD